MKNLKIGIGLLFLMVLGFQLPVAGSTPMGEPQTIAPKSPQGDTIRMYNISHAGYFSKMVSFEFWGEDGAIYKVRWKTRDQVSWSEEEVMGRGDYVRWSKKAFNITSFDIEIFGVTPEKKEND